MFCCQNNKQTLQQAECQTQFGRGESLWHHPKVKLFPLAQLVAEHRVVLCYGFGLCCLLCWFAFNLWVLRDYFFPWWYPPIYTERGLRTEKLESKKRHYLMRARMSNAFQLTASIGAGHLAREIAARRERQRLTEQERRLRFQQQRHSIAVVSLG